VLSYSKNHTKLICSGQLFKIIRQFSSIHLSSWTLPFEFWKRCWWC